MPASRWFAGGSERSAGAYAAGEALVRDNAKPLVVFCSESQDLPALIGQICAVSGGAADWLHHGR
jgi:hypothetical protein